MYVHVIWAVLLINTSGETESKVARVDVVHSISTPTVRGYKWRDYKQPRYTERQKHNPRSVTNERQIITWIMRIRVRSANNQRAPIVDDKAHPIDKGVFHDSPVVQPPLRAVLEKSGSNLQSNYRPSVQQEESGAEAGASVV